MTNFMWLILKQNSYEPYIYPSKISGNYFYLLLLLLLLIWLYNFFIGFWPSQQTLSIFFYLGQGSSSLVLLSSVYLF